MIPILYEKNATSFNTNGIGRLTDTTRCICTEERNGEYEIELEYAVSGKLFNEIKHSRIIVVKPSQNEQPQAFRIYKISKPMMNGVITVNAHHISYQLNNIPVSPFSASSLTVALQMLKSHSMESNPFTFTTNKSSTITCGATTPIMCRAMMGGHKGSLLDRYGGEWHFNNYTCELLNARGSDNGVTIRYGKNLTDLEQEENIESTYTGIVPYWQASDSDECVYANAVQSSAAGNFPFHKTEIVDFSQNFDVKPTTAQLTVIAQQYINNNNIGHPVVSLDVNFVDLANTEEYKDIAPLETVSLCDTVTVIFEKLGIEEKAKVVRTEWDVLNEKYESIQIGSIQTSLATTIASQGAAIEESLASAREFTRDATGWLTNGAGYVIANKNADGSWKELLFLDKPTTAAATKVLRINENGIGFASGAAGTFDSWIYYQAWTLDGNLSLGGVNNSYGRLKILNNTGQEIGVWDKDGIRITNGTISGTNITGNTISGGTISGTNISGGTINGTNINVGGEQEGALNIKNASDNQIGIWDKDGIKIKDANGNIIFSVSNDSVSYYSPTYQSTTYISGQTEGVRVVDSNNEAIMSCGEISVESKEDGSYSSMSGGAVSCYGQGDTATDITEGGLTTTDGTNTASIEPDVVSVTDGSDTSQVRPDGFYVNGQKLATEGYTGTLSDVCTDIEVDFDNQDYSATVNNLVFKNGLLVRIE